MIGRMVVVVLWVAGCGFSAAPAQIDASAPPDMQPPDMQPPVTCNDLACDRNATCTMAGAAACRCNPGFSGDGMTCADIDECATSNGGCQAACQNTPGSFVCYAPASCAEVKAHVSSAVDGTYTMYLGGDFHKPWRGHCAQMAGTPREYLTLDGTNSAQYTAGGQSDGQDVKTTYTKVRFDPASLKIDISDRTFATSQGMLRHASERTPVTSMPFGVAMDCRGANSRLGVALIDLTATAFALTGAGEFAENGAAPGSQTQLSMRNQRATITGGGNCGWNAPQGAPTNPFNDNVTGGKLLTLVYAP